MSNEPVVKAHGIVKELGQGAGKVKALKGVSLELQPGELTLLMGPSGSGKTTLLSILGCILTPTEGTLSIAGEATEGLSPEGLADLRRRHVGFVFQSYNLFPTLNAIENVRPVSYTHLTLPRALTTASIHPDCTPSQAPVT